MKKIKESIVNDISLISTENTIKSRIELALNDMDFYYSIYARHYESALMFDGRLKQMAIQRQQEFLFVGVHNLTATTRRAYTGFVNKLKPQKVIAASYLKKDKEDIEKKMGLFTKYFLAQEDVRTEGVNIIDEAILLGLAFGETYLKSSKDIFVNKVEYSEEGKTKFNKEELMIKDVKVRYVSIFDMILDTTGKGRFIGKRGIKSKKELREEYVESPLREGMNKIDFDNLSPYTETKNGGRENTRMRTYDYNRVKRVDLTQKYFDEIANTDADKCCSSLEKWLYAEPNMDGLYEVIEFYDTSEDEIKKYLIINGTIYYNGDTNLPYSGTPFSLLYYDHIPGQIDGRGIASILEKYQKDANLTYCALNFAIKVLSYPTFRKVETFSGRNSKNQSNSIKIEPFGIVPEGLELVKIIDPSTITLLENRIAVIKGEAYQDTLTGTFNYGGDGKVLRVSGDVTERTRTRDNKISKFFDNIAGFYSDIMNKVVMLQQVYGSKIPLIEGVSISNKELIDGIYITFNGDEVIGYKDQMLQNLINALQVAGPYIGSDLDVQKVGQYISDLSGLEGFMLSDEEKQKRAEGAISTPDISKTTMSINFGDLSPIAKMMVESKELGIPIEQLQQQMQQQQVPQEQPIPEQQMPIEQTVQPDNIPQEDSIDMSKIPDDLKQFFPTQ